MEQLHFAVVAPPDPSPAERVLALIRRGVPLVARSLAQETGMSPETVGACLANLSARGLIREIEPGMWATDAPEARA